MAKKSSKKTEQPKRRSLLSSLFEPAEESETEFSFGEFEPDKQDLEQAFDDDIPDLFDEPLKEPSKPKKKTAEKTGPGKRSFFARKHFENAAAGKASDAGDSSEGKTASLDPSLKESPSPIEETPADSDAVSASEELASSEAQPVETASPSADSSDTASADDHTAPQETEKKHGPSIADFLARGKGEPETPAESSESPSGPAAEAEHTEEPSKAADEADDFSRSHKESDQEKSDASKEDKSSADSEEPIRLFDDEDEEEKSQPRRHRTHTKDVYGSNGLRTRVHLNETEAYRNAEAARERERAIIEKEQKARDEQKAKRKKKRRRTVKQMAMNLTIGGICAFILLLVSFFLFRLSDIVVTGNSQYDTDYIVELSGLKLGRHMLFCDLDAAKTGIETNPYLQVDSVDYIFPARVRIKVTERKEVAAIVGLDYSVIIDHSGYVLSMSGGIDVSSLVQVTGVSMSGFQVGQRLGQSDDFSTATLLSIISGLEDYNLLDSIAAIDMTTPLAITLTARSGLKIFVGQTTDLAEKMATLYKLLPRFNQSNITSGTLYLSAKGGAVYSPAGSAESAETSVSDTADSSDTTVVIGTDGTVTTADGTGTAAVQATATPAPQATPDPNQEDGFQG